jgi:hypothetical protein
MVPIRTQLFEYIAFLQLLRILKLSTLIFPIKNKRILKLCRYSDIGQIYVTRLRRRTTHDKFKEMNLFIGLTYSILSKFATVEPLNFHSTNQQLQLKIHTSKWAGGLKLFYFLEALQ